MPSAVHLDDAVEEDSVLRLGSSDQNLGHHACARIWASAQYDFVPFDKREVHVTS